MSNTSLWEPFNNGGGKRMWFVARAETFPIEDRYHYDSKGVLIRYASMAGAQKAADKLNKKEGNPMSTVHTSQPRLSVVREALESVIATLPGTVYYAADGSALFLHEDGLSIVRVATDGTTSSAYTATVPLANLFGDDGALIENLVVEDLPELEGWTSGWTC